MNKVIFFFLAQFSCGFCAFQDSFSAFQVKVNPSVHISTVQGVAKRLLGPEKAALFSFKIASNWEYEHDGFRIWKDEDDEKVHVTGPNGVSLCWGLHYYLKKFCNCHISWDGDQLDLPKRLPEVEVTVFANDKLRYYQNACTSSYSFVWWDWKRWEREIDWMALNGINIALAFNGQEAIWQRVFDAIGIQGNDFTGPAFLAWYRMGNLRNFSYGLNHNWHKTQVDLQHKILKRMRNLGITPVLPGFCGIVPTYFKNIFPLANMKKMPRWGKFTDKFCCPLFVDPGDPVYYLVSHVYMREYINEFGTNHIYSCDTFNENSPPSKDLKYLKHVSHLIFKNMRMVDSSAVWMIQGWMFLDPFWINKQLAKAFLEGVPRGGLIVLDLQADLTPQFERLDSFFGHAFIWCTLHNFGGQLGMYGHLNRINKGVIHGRSIMNSTMVGIGIAPEGINQNYVIYEFTLESTFRHASINLNHWITNYATRRYGTHNANLEAAWIILKDTVYNYRPEALHREHPDGADPTTLLLGEHISKNILVRFPTTKMNELMWYNRSRIYDVFNKFVNATHDKKLNASELFKHDLVDVTRQTVQLAIGILYFGIMNAYTINSPDDFENRASMFLEMLENLDIVLASHKNFLLGTWLEAAKSCAKDKSESIQYEFNARNQITLWGPNGEIRDYAAKQWAGLMASYYTPRWRIFLETLFKRSVPYNPAELKKHIFEVVEKPFGVSRSIYPKEPEGQTIPIIQHFSDKWGPSLYEIFRNYTSYITPPKNA